MKNLLQHAGWRTMLTNSFLLPIKNSKYFLLILFITLGSAGDTGQANSDGKDLAKSLNTTKVNPAAANFDPNSMPGYQGTDVPQKQYYDTGENGGSNLEEKGHESAQTDSTALYIKDAHNNRPKMTMDTQTDPLFKRQSEISQKSTSLTSTYSGCVELPVGDTDVTISETKTCHEFGSQDQINFSCIKNVSATCPNANVSIPFQPADFTLGGSLPFARGNNGETFWFGGTTDFRSGNCASFTNTITFQIADINQIDSFVINSVIYDDWLDVQVNGTLVFRGVGASQGLTVSKSGKCDRKGDFSASNINIKNKLKVGTNTITIINQVGGGGGAYINFTAHRIKGCTPVFTTGYVCPPGQTNVGSDLLSSICTAPAETRMIDGFPVFKECWAWKEDFKALGIPEFTKEPMCDQLVADGCGQISASCINSNGVFCADQLLTYSCQHETSARKTTLCGSQLVCPDGNCTSDVNRTNEIKPEDFQKAATGLAVAKEISEGYSANNVSVFHGTNNKCEKKPFGFADCCADSGWGNDLGLNSCEASEKALGMAKQTKQTHYIGSYESGGILDTRKYYVFCIYPSKLSRIIIEQGRAQLGLNYGTPKAPDCSGFTLDQLSHLNFGAMDLSEFYADVVAKANNGTTPSSTTATKDIQDKLTAKFPQTQGN